MGKAWIENLADDIKNEGRDAAESYGRDQHRAGIVAGEGQVFFTALVTCLEQDVAEIRSQLQGSAVSCETSVVKDGPAQVKLSRDRFPWFDATLKHEGETIVLDYAKGRGAAEDKNLRESTERQTACFAFQVDGQDRLSTTEAFGDDPHTFHQPEELSKHIVELLFKL
ncbi:MAG: hypothetical protein ABI197_09340 [Granulicella sp.]